MTKRDEFTKPDREAVAKRAHYFCSNPGCIKLTAGPHSQPGKALLTGIAAHIHAAASGGPRYEAAQGTNRTDISNAIWLCHDCSDLVDKDEVGYPADLLRQWKADHERMISEVRLKGYSDSLRLLQARANEPGVAHRLFALISDRRVLWAALDAEFPDRVRGSLELLRGQLVDMRGAVGAQSLLDVHLGALQRIILAFFDRVEQLDLVHLRCDSGNSEWLHFRDTLQSFRKAFGLQLAQIATEFRVPVSQDLADSFPALAGVQIAAVSREPS